MTYLYKFIPLVYDEVIRLKLEIVICILGIKSISQL